jgi:hypothetical protein
MSCESLGVHAHPCSALVQGVCRNGFPFSRGCLPAHVVGPDGREQWLAAVPHCCDEEFPHSANGDGK